MQLTRLTLSAFRNHHQASFEFHPPTTIIFGDNASGKTSIIEAVYLLATGDSFRATKIEEMIRFGQEIGRVAGSVADGEAVNVDDAETTELEILLTRGMVQGKRTQGRLFSVNGVRRRKAALIGNLTAVVFRPEDMRLIEGSPARRRSFLDHPLVMVHQEYARSLSTYDQTLRRRNKLLEQVRDREAPVTVLNYWDQSLLKHGQIIQEYRRRFFDAMGRVGFPIPFQGVYQPSLITLERMQNYNSREIAAGHTLIGPHKDDFSVELPVSVISQADHWQPQAPQVSKPQTPTRVIEATGVVGANDLVSVGTYGSRGQQRLAVLWLKVCELAYLEKVTTQKPLLLLDDILSELDERSQRYVLDMTASHQTLLTTADQDTFTYVTTVLPQAQVLSLTSLDPRVAA